MIQPQLDDRRPPITPQLALRVAILGGVALVLFALVFFRLWYLQVLSGDQLRSEANDNRVRQLVVQAPRGEIVDRNGSVLVESRVATVIQLDTERIPKAGAARQDLYRRLGKVLRQKPVEIRREVVEQKKLVPYAKATIKVDAPLAVTQYLAERKREFPGITVEREYLRSYPHRTVAAQLFGTVGKISPEELKQRHFRGVGQDTKVGKSGIEYEYDRYLRGINGASRVQVDSLGRPKGAELARREPEPGRRLKLTIDLELQRSAQEAVEQAIGRHPGATAGGFVAMDPENGEVLALGSYPSFDPNIFSRPLTQRKFEAIQNQRGAPLFNRALSGAYPAASTFKLVTAVAALEEGLISAGEVINDPGVFKLGPQTFTNAGKVAHGAVDLRKALQVSSDVYFYRLGAQANSRKGQLIQTWAKRLGIGRDSGIDIPNEFTGTVPDRAWRAEINRLELQCQKREKKSACGISDGREWSGGDNVNLSVGQGDLQTNPLQMAIAYSTVVNGGRVVRPRLAQQVEDPDGGVSQEFQNSVRRRVKIAPQTRSAVMDGLRAAAMEPGGTSSDVFKGFPRTVFGKTGTAETSQGDQSWYVAYVPAGKRSIVVAVTIEKGGFGAESAAPVARLILSQWFGIKGEFVAGDSRTQ